MRRELKIYREHALAAVLLLVPAMGAGQAQGVTPQDASASQAVSQTGVFPVFAVTMNFQGSLVDGAAAPSKAANSGVDNVIQQAWDTLKASGFNTILFKVDLNDPQAAARTANLCIWAKANNASLIPVLANASSSMAAAFPATVISLLRAGDGQQFAAYTQVSYFQLESPLNLPLPNASTKRSENHKLLVEAVDSLRNAELQALTGTGVQPTPIMLNASFDYELIQQGAIAGVPLDAAAEQKAVAALKKSLQTFAGATNVNAVMVSWFPRSITSGDEGHFVSLLREVEATLPDKKVFLDTGFSSAFNSGDQQSQFMTISLTNLAGLRASEGADGRFLGVGVSQAFNESVAEIQGSAGTSDPSQWNWGDKARQLSQMWSQGTKSADLTSWLAKVRGGRALLTVQAGGTGFVASPGLQAIQQFSTTVAQVSQNMAPATISSAGQTALTPGQTPSSDPASASAALSSQSLSGSPAAIAGSGTSAIPNAVPFAGPSTPSVYSQMLQALVQQVTTQITTAMVTKLTNSSPKQTQYGAYPAPNGVPANGQIFNGSSNYNSGPQGAPFPASQGFSPVQLGPQDVNLDVANPSPGQTVHITAQLHNGSADQDISGLKVQLVDAANPASPQASQTGVAVPRMGVIPVQLTWMASQPNGGPPTLLIQVLDVNGSQVASAGVPAITVANASAGTNSGTANAAPYSSNSASQTAATQPGQSVSSGNASANAPTAINASANASNSDLVTAHSQQTQGLASSNAQMGTPPVAQPQIVYFGPAGTVGQNATLSLQVTNPAATLISSAQAQLYLDGTPGPAQTLGPLLPSQTGSITFDTSTLVAGNHNIKVVVTTADGASASATVSPIASPASSRSADLSKLGPASVRIGPLVRSRVPSGFQIGGVTIAPPSPSAPSQASPGPVSTATASNQGGIANQTANGSTAATATRSPGLAIPPRTISQGSTAPNPRAAATTVPPAPGSSQIIAVRSLPIQGSAAASQSGSISTALPVGGPTVGPGARTVVPSAASTATQTTTRATVLPPRPGPGSGINTPVAPGAATTSTAPATAVLPQGRMLSGQPAGAPANSAPGGAFLDLSVAATEIRFLPAAPGQSTTFTAVIHNLGTLGAQGASYVFALNADGRIMSSRPSLCNVPAGGSFQASWTAPMPVGQVVQLVVQVMANGDINPANNQATIRLH